MLQPDYKVYHHGWLKEFSHIPLLSHSDKITSKLHLLTYCSSNTAVLGY